MKRSDLIEAEKLARGILRALGALQRNEIAMEAIMATVGGITADNAALAIVTSIAMAHAQARQDAAAPHDRKAIGVLVLRVPTSSSGSESIATMQVLDDEQTRLLVSKSIGGISSSN